LTGQKEWQVTLTEPESNAEATAAQSIVESVSGVVFCDKSYLTSTAVKVIDY
jgi:hypothetical protein